MPTSHVPPVCPRPLISNAWIAIAIAIAMLGLLWLVLHVPFAFHEKIVTQLQRILAITEKDGRSPDFR